MEIKDQAYFLTFVNLQINFNDIPHGNHIPSQGLKGALIREDITKMIWRGIVFIQPQIKSSYSGYRNQVLSSNSSIAKTFVRIE